MRAFKFRRLVPPETIRSGTRIVRKRNFHRIPQVRMAFPKITKPQKDILMHAFSIRRTPIEQFKIEGKPLAMLRNFPPDIAIPLGNSQRAQFSYAIENQYPSLAIRLPLAILHAIRLRVKIRPFIPCAIKPILGDCAEKLFVQTMRRDKHPVRVRPNRPIGIVLLPPVGAEPNMSRRINDRCPLVIDDPINEFRFRPIFVSVAQLFRQRIPHRQCRERNATKCDQNAAPKKGRNVPHEFHER